MNTKLAQRCRDTQVWTLSSYPLHIKMTLRNEVLVLSSMASAPTRQRPLSHARATVQLTKAETQTLFRGLGTGLGYELPSSCAATGDHRAHVTMLSLTGEQEALGIVVWFENGQHGDVFGNITAWVPLRKALKIFKDLADPLGWELYEYEVVGEEVAE